MRPARGILIGAVFSALTLGGGVIGYALLGCTFFDAVYMVIITIFGIGFGEFCPISWGSRLFTIFVIVAGVISAAFIVGGFVQMVTEGEIHRVLDTHRKIQDLARLENHAIVCGYGRIGQVLARKLVDACHPFVIVDNNSDRIASAEAMGYRVCQGNASDELVLQSAGIERAKVLATVLPDDAINVFITLTARELNPNLMIVARGEMPSTEKKLRLAGANHVISPASISGLRMANLITHPNTIEFLDQSEERTRLNELLAQIDIQVDELTVPPNSPLVGRTIADLEVRGKGTFIVVALRRHEGTLLTHPKHDEVLQNGDTVIVLGHHGDIPQFARMYEIKQQLRYRGGRA
ncbi:MAG: potassium channel protein [Oscillatoriophycideae cyanobacterium NC_groundwater_1537_Pr4_S-0.65um_50_18]|nr:potassium channel protein [Oscillatoriophycideae cyanobacterium NC_groundwater_1537_Pr4_S-0.65um_50_18]